MRSKLSRSTPIRKVVLEIQALEDRVPVSEQVGTVASLAVLGAACPRFGAGTPALESGPSRTWSGGERPAGIPSPRQIALVREEAAASVLPVRRAPAPTVLPDDDLPDLFALLDWPPQNQRHPVGSRDGLAGAGSPGADLAGTSVETAPQTSGAIGSSPSPIVAPAVGNVGTSLLPPLPGAAPGAVAAPVASRPTSVESLGRLGGSHQNPPPPDLQPVPIWVLDANNAIVVTPGVTKHDFSGWDVDLRAQVAGGTVSSYSWDVSQAGDVTNASGQGTYNLTFTWATFNQGANGPHTDTIVLTTNDSVHGQQTQTLTFSVIGQDSPAWVAAASRPATVNTWLPTVPVISPDALTPRQETIDSQYYSLGEATGELLTAHALPQYNTGVPPLTLAYSSLAADSQPVFIDHHTLDKSQAAPDWVKTQLTLLSGGTPVYSGQAYHYNTSLLNPGDVMQIALQATGIGGLNSGRYTYQITITADYPTQKIQTDSGTVSLVNSAADFGNIFGNGAGWSVVGLHRLLPQGTNGANGAILDLGLGQSLWFAPNGSGGFNRPAGDFSTLTYDSGSNTYRRLLPDGTRYTFDGTGREIAVADRNANTYTYSYDGNGKLLSIQDFNSQTLTLAYNAAGTVKSVTDPAGRVTSLAYDVGGRLNTITDPTPAVGVAAPVTAFAYDTGVNHILTLTDPDNHVTTFTYNAAGRVSSVARPDGFSEQLTALQMAGLISVGYGTTPDTAVTATLAVQAQAQYTNGRSYSWNTRLDWLGFGQMTQDTDPNSGQAATHRDANGLPWLEADQLGRRTRTFFDTNGNPTTAALADETYELYSGYNTFNEPGSYRDPRGNVTSYTYDANGNLTKITQPSVVYDTMGHMDYPVTTLTYNPGGWVQSITDPNNHTTSFNYDATIKNRLLYMTEPLANQSVNYGYDSYGNVNRVTDERGIATSYGFDALNRLVNVTLANDSPPNSLYTLVYDAAGNLTQLVDPLSHTWTWGYDALNREVSAADPLGHTWTSTYDGAGNLLTRKDPLLHVTTLGYDAANHLTSVTDPLTHSTTYGVDAAGQVVSVTDALGHTTSYTYNLRGWETAMTTPLGDQTTFAYNASGDLTAVTEYDHTGQAAPATTAMVYDALHRVSAYTDAVGVTSTFTYDKVGNLIEAIGPLPGGGPPAAAWPGACGCGVKDMAYNSLDQMISETDSMGQTTSFVYDAHGNRTGVTDANLHTVTTTYDAQNRPRSNVLPPQGVPGPMPTTTYTYDPAGNLVSVTDPDLNVTTYHYDDANRLWYTTDPNSNTTSYAFDAANRLTSITDRLNRTRTFAYDAADRLLTEQWVGGNYTATYGYDAANRLTSASDPNSAYTYGYDAADRLISDSKASTPAMPAVVLTYAYDGLNNRTSLVDNVSINGQTGQITYSYDGDHHLKGETWLAGATQLANVTLHYDGKNRLDQINRITPGGAAVTTTIGHDANDQITTITHSVDGSTLADFSYTYDPAHRLQSATEWGVTKTYTYDATDQLTAVTPSTGAGESFTYDLNGNRTSANGVNYGTPAAGNRLTFDGTYTYTYSAEGTLISKAGPNDVTTFTYDYRNRLIEARRTLNGTVSDDVFTYDVWDRQVGKVETTNGTATVTRWTAYDGPNPYADYDGTAWRTRYLYGAAVDQLFARYDATNGVEWYLTDRLGSVVDIVSASGSSLDTITYSSFGQIASESSPGNGDRFKFTGREWDAAIGQYDYRARYYDPSVGRFNSEDPIGFRAGDANLYRYVDNSPVNSSDPSGLAPAAMPEKLPPGFSGFTEPILEGNQQVGWRNPNTGETLRWEGGGPHGPHWDWQGIKDDRGRPTKIRLRPNGKPVEPSDARKLSRIRPGCVRASALAAALGTTVIAGGVEYAYGEYLSKGEEGGTKMAMRVGLGEALMLADADESQGPEGLLPGRTFDVMFQGRRIHVCIIEQDGKKYITAWYTADRWGIFTGSYQEPVDVITPKDGFRVYRVR